MGVPQIIILAPTSKISLRTPQSVRTKEDVFPIWIELAKSGRSHDTTYQEYDGNVEQKSHHGVCDQYHEANVVDVLHGHSWHFSEQGNHAVHKGADWREVVLLIC